MFTKKIISLLLIVAASLLLTISTASAYELSWKDQTNPAFDIGGYQFVTSTTDYANIKQYINGAFTFTEEVSLTILNTLNDDGSGIIPPVYQGDYKAKLALSGYSNVSGNASTVYFTGGSGDLLHDNVSFLGFTYEESLPSTFDASIYSDTGESSDFDITFGVDSYDPLYLTAISGLGIQDLINNDWLQLIASGRFQIDSISSPNVDSGGSYVNIGATASGVVAKFNVVPEPSTMFLLGFGLLGLAIISRKRVS